MDELSKKIIRSKIFSNMVKYQNKIDKSTYIKLQKSLTCDKTLNEILKMYDFLFYIHIDDLKKCEVFD